jgi:hypothetical protein
MKISNDVIDWLLEEENPPVRYLTLINLLEKSEKSPLVKKTKTSLMGYKVTQDILKHCDEFWNLPDKDYWKYTGKYWQLIFLGQFLADGKDPRIAGGALKVLEKRSWVTKAGGQCLTANLLAAFRRLGYGDNPIVIEETESLAKRVISDKGLICGDMDYSLLPRCYMALPKQLLMFAEVPPGERSETIRKAIDCIVQTMLDNGVYKYVPSRSKAWRKILEGAPKRNELPKGQSVKNWIANRKKRFIKSDGIGMKTGKQGWLKFGFPLHYNSDILEAMYALALHNTPMDPRLEKPLEIITDKMTPSGKWNLDNSLNGKMWSDVEEKGLPSKWITYFALYVLNHFERFK